MDDFQLIKAHPLEFLRILFGNPLVTQPNECRLCMTVGGHLVSLSNYIMHLNDHDKLSRSEIADKLDLLGKYPMKCTYAEAVALLREEVRTTIDLVNEAFKYTFNYNTGPYPTNHLDGLGKYLGEMFPKAQFEFRRSPTLDVYYVDFLTDATPYIPEDSKNTTVKIEDSVFPVVAYRTFAPFRVRHALAANLLKQANTWSMVAYDIESGIHKHAKSFFGDQYMDYCRMFLDGPVDNPEVASYLKMLNLMKSAYSIPPLKYTFSAEY